MIVKLILPGGLKLGKQSKLKVQTKYLKIFCLRPPRRRRKRVSRSLSSSRPEPDGRYLDTPPPYTPDLEPPNYPDNQPKRTQNLDPRPIVEPLHDVKLKPPSLESKSDADAIDRETKNHERKGCSSKITHSQTSAMKYLKKDSNDDSKIENEQSFLTVKDSDDDVEQVHDNRPRNPPIISEIEEELKPGNRRKNVRHVMTIKSRKCNLCSQNYLAHRVLIFTKLFMCTITIRLLHGCGLGNRG